MTLLIVIAQLGAFAFLWLFGSELLGAEAGLRTATQVVFTAPLVAWAAFRLRGPAGAIDWAIVAALAALAIVAVASADPQGSRDSVGLAIAYALTFWAMRAAAANERLRTALAVSAGLALTSWLVLAAAFWIGEKVEWLRVVGTVPPLESAQVFIWGTTNAFPILALLALPFLAWQRPGPARVALTVVWGLATVVVLPLSMGRAAWVAFAVALGAYEGLAGWPRCRRAIGWLRARAVVGAAVVVVAIAVVAMVAWQGTPRLADGIGGDRLRVWGQALAIFSADPLTGGGPTTFSWIRLGHVPDFVYPVPVRLSHDVVLQTLADGGLLLVVAFAVLLSTYLLQARRHLADARRRLGLAVLLGFAAACLLDDFSSLPAVMIGAVTVAAWVVAPAERLAPGVGPRGWGLPIAIVVLATIALPAVIGVDAARMAAADGRGSAIRGDWPAATRQFEEAVAAYPESAGYWLGLGLVAWHSGDESRSRQAYQRAYALNPADPRAAGAIAATSDDPAEAAAMLEIAARHGITDPQYAYRLGDLYWDAGARQAALEAYGLAVSIDARLIAAFSGQAPSRGEVADAARAQVARLNALDGYVVRDTVLLDLDLALGNDLASAPLPWRAAAALRDGAAVFAQELTGPLLDAAARDPRALSAAAAVARFACNGWRTSALLGVAAVPQSPRPSEVREVRDHTYRDQSLGSYQPLAADPYPAPEPWPWPLIAIPVGGC